MPKDTFEFRLSDDACEDEYDKEVVFAATKINSEEYMISWIDEEGKGSIEYSIPLVRKLIEEGSWIALS